MTTPDLAAARAAYRRFIDACRAPDGEFRLTPLADATTYALCFAIFGLHLLRDDEALAAGRGAWNAKLRQALDDLRVRQPAPARSKPYLQLLTFTLSALHILETLADDPLARQVLPLLPDQIESELEQTHALQGRARSGNHAMFMAILLLHARQSLGTDTTAALERWVQCHRAAMNRFGFWGSGSSMSHLQFQNGYHQYEILEYLDVPDVPWDCAADAVATLADPQGRFAPYPGGGGCYDYDAVFILTATPASTQRHAALLKRTGNAILAEQNADGGFGESHSIRPRSAANLLRSLQHVRAAAGRARVERLRQAVTLLRPKHDRIHTHWSQYSREWDESDLWDSWFRMLTLARIECAVHPERATNWGFISFPGIGFHPSLRSSPQPAALHSVPVQVETAFPATPA
jgi:hypothetical protein